MTALALALGLVGTALLLRLMWLLDPELRRAAWRAYWSARIWWEVDRDRS